MRRMDSIRPLEFKIGLIQNYLKYNFNSYCNNNMTTAILVRSHQTEIHKDFSPVKKDMPFEYTEKSNFSMKKYHH